MRTYMVPRHVGGRRVLQPVDVTSLVWGAYARESDADDEVQVTAQMSDACDLSLSIGGRIDEKCKFSENNTSAFKKQRVPLPDGTYGYRVIRKDFNELLTSARTGRINAIAFTNIDRAMRDPRDLEELIDVVEYYGVLVVAVTGFIDLTTDEGISSARQMVAQRNMESRNTGRRVAIGNRRAAFKGHSHGGGTRSFGWRKGNKKLSKRESKLLESAKDRVLAGAKPREIVMEWNDKGIRTVKGGPWVTQTLTQILRNPRLCGWVMYQGEILRDPDTNEPVKGDWETIFSAQDHVALVELLPKGNGGGQSKGGSVTRQLLSGIARCGKCTGKLRASNAWYKNGRGKYRVYKCPGKGDGGCGGVTRQSQPVEDFIRDLVIAHETEKSSARRSDGPPEWPKEAELTGVNKRIHETTASYKAERMSGETYFPLIEDMERQRAKLRTEKRAHEKRYPKDLTGDVDLAAEWDKPEFTLEQRQNAIRRSLSAVIINPSGMGRKFDPSSIVPVWR